MLLTTWAISSSLMPWLIPSDMPRSNTSSALGRPPSGTRWSTPRIMGWRVTLPLHTVRVSMRSGRLTCEPFLIVGLIASIRRVLVITLQSSEITPAKDWSPEKQALFQASMIELAVLAGLILTMVFAIFVLHRARDDGRPAGEEAQEQAGP